MGGPLIAKDKYYPTQAIIDDAENYRDQNYGVQGLNTRRL